MIMGLFCGAEVKIVEASHATTTLDRARAELNSGFLAEFAAAIIRDEFPYLKEKMHMRSAVIDWRSRVMEFIDCRAT